MNAQVMPGYKLTDAGVYPEDWLACELGDLAPYVTSGSRGWAEYYSDRGDPFVRITNLSRSTIYIDQSDLKFVRLPVNDSEGLRTALTDGDLLISITADIGIIGYVDSSLPKPSYINQHIALVRFSNHDICSKYLSYFLSGERTQRLFRGTTDQGAKAGMNLAGIRAIKAVLPPIAEQRAIAAALSDMDALVSGMDQLIAKKRDIKQATTQQLLTGQQRLPGFSGEWEVKRLFEICGMKSGEGITSSDIDEHSKYPCYGGNGMRGYAKTYTHEGAYVLIGRQGALCGNVVVTRGRFFASEHAIVTTPLSSIDVSWLALVLRDMNLNQYSESSAQPGLSVVKLLALPCLAPPLKEQIAIATILSDMDIELTTLETRRNKAQQVKQGMMEELLTGRIRLL